MTTIQVFDAAYQKYVKTINLDDYPEILPTSALIQPLKQFEDTMKAKNEGHPSYKDAEAFLMFFIIFGAEPGSITIGKQVVHSGGQTFMSDTTSELLNDHL